MELPEKIDEINKQLLDIYGRHNADKPNFRVVYTWDQFEHRKMTHTNEGFQLVQPEIRFVPKYRHFIKEGFWALERLVPVTGDTDLVEEISYEIAWLFINAKMEEPLPPRYAACQVVIETLLSKVKQGQYYKTFKDPDLDPNARAAKIDAMQEMLFGNETSVGDALAHGSGIVSAGIGEGN